MHRTAAVLALALALPATAREGTVRTPEGQRFEGQIRLVTNAVVVASLSQGFITNLPLAQVSSLEFNDDPAQARISSVLDLPPPPRPEGLPAPWEKAEIGGGPLGSKAEFRFNVFDLRDPGSAVGGQDAGPFVYKKVTGESELIARLLHLDRRDPWAKAGLMMREGLDRQSRFVRVVVDASGKLVLQWRESAASELSVAELGQVTRPIWLRLKRDGDVILCFHSRNGRNWSVAQKVNLPLAAEMFVGLALSGHEPTRPARAMFDSVREAPWLPHPSFTPRVELRSGSMVVGQILATDDRVVRFVSPIERPALPVASVSRILFNWLSDRAAARVGQNTAGVLLANHQFMDADCRGIEGWRLTMSSVQYGLFTFDVNHEVTAVFLRPPNKPRPRFRIKETDGTIWIADHVEIGWNEISFDEPLLGRCKVLVSEIAELTRSL